MDPWEGKKSKPLIERDSPHVICPNYPVCPKEERRLLNEVRSLQTNISPNHKLSNGMRVTDFCLQYTMIHHFKRKHQK